MPRASHEAGGRSKESAMQKGTFMRWFVGWFLVWILAAVVLLCLSLGVRVAAATASAGNTPATDPRFDDASGDDGRTWTLKSEYRMKRQRAAPFVL